ncbi:MAG: hypothetical protein QXR53_02715 [Candidatus Norongarragalinales archaeon]
MAKTDDERLTDVLRELDKNKFARMVADRWYDLSKQNAKMTTIIVFAVLATVLILNWQEKLTMETNGWVIASLIGYLFGRGQK